MSLEAHSRFMHFECSRSVVGAGKMSMNADWGQLHGVQ